MRTPLYKSEPEPAWDELQGYICRTVEKGMARQELNEDLDAQDVAAILLSTLEGALMMSKLYGDSSYMKRAVAHLGKYIDEELKDTAG